MYSIRDQTGGETALQEFPELVIGFIPLGKLLFSKTMIIDASAQAKSVSMNLAPHGYRGPHKQVNDLQ